MDTQRKVRLGTMILEQLASNAKRTAIEMDSHQRTIISRLTPTAKSLLRLLSNVQGSSDRFLELLNVASP